jgi:hypothetical protein
MYHVPCTPTNANVPLVHSRSCAAPRALLNHCQCCPTSRSPWPGLCQHRHQQAGDDYWCRLPARRSRSIQSYKPTRPSHRWRRLPTRCYPHAEAGCQHDPCLQSRPHPRPLQVCLHLQCGWHLHDPRRQLALGWRKHQPRGTMDFIQQRLPYSRVRYYRKLQELSQYSGFLLCERGYE